MRARCMPRARGRWLMFDIIFSKEEASFLVGGGHHLTSYPKWLIYIYIYIDVSGFRDPPLGPFKTYQNGIPEPSYFGPRMLQLVKSDCSSW